MTATNHALTGAIIGLSIGNPWLALPIAILSHFVLDALPHFGNKRLGKASREFRYLLTADATLCVMLVAVLFLAHEPHWFLAASCAFLATSPDLMWVGEFIQAQRHKRLAPRRALLMRFHGAIQWFERPIGAAVEGVWFLSAVTVLTIVLASS